MSYGLTIAIIIIARGYGHHNSQPQVNFSTAPDSLTFTSSSLNHAVALSFLTDYPGIFFVPMPIELNQSITKIDKYINLLRQFILPEIMCAESAC